MLFAPRIMMPAEVAFGFAASELALSSAPTKSAQGDVVVLLAFSPKPSRHPRLQKKSSFIPRNKDGHRHTSHMTTLLNVVNKRIHRLQNTQNIT